MKDIFVIAHDMRSTHNVGSLFRTCEGMGVRKLYLTGYSPYPRHKNDNRLPHIANKLDRQIQKTALSSQDSLDWEHANEPKNVIKQLKNMGVQILALEQTAKAINLHEFKTTSDVAIILGTEVSGLPQDIINLTDNQVAIPMLGQKESYNVIQAAAMALYQLRFH